MKKRMLALVLVLSIFVSFSSGIVPFVRAENTLPTYDAQENFGAEVFSYYSRNITNGVTTEMVFNEGAGLYMDGSTSNYIGTRYLTTGVDPAVCSILVFTAPYSGSITISNGLIDGKDGIVNTGHQVDMTNFAVCYATIYSHDWTVLGDYSIPANNSAVEIADVTGIKVEAGQEIKFMVGSNTPMNSYIYWIPVISYTEVENMEHQHQWQAEWQSDENYHWHDCTSSCDITDNAQKDGYGAHSDESGDGKCDTCSYELQQVSTLPSYNANENYGSEVFGYYSRNITNGVTTEMAFNEGAGLYMDGATANYIGTRYLTTGVDPAVCSILVFKAPYSGTITISNDLIDGVDGIVNTGHQVDMTNFAVCYATIYSHDWKVLGDYSIPANNTAVEIADVTDIKVEAGQEIKFMVGSNTPMNSYIYWVPIITYTEVIQENAWSAERDYGSEVFSYYSRNITNGFTTEMAFNEGAGLYIDGATANYIGTRYLTTGVDPAVCSMLVFKAPYSGTITISNGLIDGVDGIINTGRDVDKTNFAVCYAMIYSPEWKVIGDYSIPANGTPVEIPDITGITVEAGQEIKFIVGSNTPMNSYIYWIPVISYTSIQENNSSTMTIDELLAPVWEGDVVYNESVMVLKNQDGSIDPISLIYPINEIVSIRDYSLSYEYQEDVDYVIEDGKLVVLPDGAIPQTDYDQYYLESELGGNSFAATSGGYIFFAEGSYFHQKQISITYKHTGTWQGAVPEQQGEKLPITINKLENKDPLKIVFYGDSITVGANSSGFIGSKPNLPTWPEMVTNALKYKYGYEDIVSVNNAQGGQGIVWGLENINSLVAAEAPDLVFIGFGMNDNTSNASYGQYIKSMIERVRQSNPNCEFVLVGTMLPNAEVSGFFTNQDKYVLALDEIAKDNSGIAVADVTTVHSDLLKIKRYYDMTGNNVNHPNDFLARIYLQVAMKTLTPGGDDVEGVKLLAPTNDAEVAVVSGAVANWVKDYTVDSTGAGDYMGKGDNYYAGVTLRWKVAENANSYIISYGTNKDLSDAKSIAVTDRTSLILHNLFVGTTYYWMVEAVYAGDSIESEVYSFTTADTPRTVMIDGVSNTRDLGGYAISEKTNIKQGMIYRGATLNDISEEGLQQALVELGIQTELDLRGYGEDNCGILFPLGDKVGYYNYHTTYYGNIMNEENWPDLAAAIKLFADEDNYPIYFHCRLGRDRTGTLALLLLGLLGASKEQIFVDYELSCFSYMGGAYDGANHSGVKYNLNSLYDALENYSGGTFQQNVEKYMLDIGVTAEEIASIRALLWDTENTGATHSHDWMYAWQSNGTHHWHECITGCEMADAQKGGYAEHDDNAMDGYCDVCGAEVSLPGVEDKVYSFTDMFSGEQTDIWHYLMRELVTNTYTEMKWNGERWEDGKGGIITKDWLHASADASEKHEMQVCLEFVAPYDGVVSMRMFGGAIKVGSDSQNGVRVAIWNNNDAILSYTDIGPGETYDFAPTEVRVKKGDCIRFLVTAITGNNAGDATIMLPIIAYLQGEDHEAHIWSEEWTSNDTHHWHECTSYCEMAHEEKNGYAKHTDIMLDGVCDVCAHTVALPGVANNVYSFTDMFSNSQSGVWKYKMREVVTNTYKNMKWNGERWEDGKGGIIAKDWMHASADAGDNHEMQVCLEYVAPYDGVISLTMFGGAIKVGTDSQNGVRIAIWNNTDAILSYTDIGPGEAYEFAPKRVKVDKGDCIRFLVTAIGGNNAGDATVMLPIIAYKSIEYRLGPDQGFYSSMDMFSSQQTDIWQYLKREVVSGTIEELTWNGERWIDGMGGIIAKEFMHASADGSDKHEIHMCLSFAAPSDGVVKIGMEDDVINVSADSQNGVRVGIMHNGNMIYSYTDLSRGRDHYFAPITINITKGDKIYFLLSPIAGNNAGDAATLVPWIHYLSYEKAPDPVLEEVPDDPSKTYYNSADDFGGYLNPWYYYYCAFGSQKLIPMTWNAQTNTFVVSGFGGLQINASGSHPYPGYDAVRVFRAPKSGTIRITMNDNGISLANGTSGVEDGVFVSVRLSDGASITELFKKTLVLPGETLPFEPIELKIYEGWELWFVVNCNTNNASDAAQYLPIVEYLEITDEEAPVYSNREEDTNELSLDELNPDVSKNGVGGVKNTNIWLIVAVFAATAVVANIIIVLVFKRKKKA